MNAPDWQHYVRLSDLYYKNAQEYAQNQEFSKATELLWGALATAIKAIAAVTGKPLTAHRHGADSLETFVTEIAKVRGEPQLLSDFLDAQAMHRNFYEGDMSPQYERKYFALTKRTIATLYQDLPTPPDVPESSS